MCLVKIGISFLLLLEVQRVVMFCVAYCPKVLASQFESASALEREAFLQRWCLFCKRSICQMVSWHFFCKCKVDVPSD
uniref:Putative secreted protein n=1 Tax=Amblyomma triste TaxID=251400 RepID=A0A023FZR9_AMBTT